MKRKTNISVLDNRGIRVTPNMIVGEEFNGYSSGDILDANATIALIKYLIRQGVIPAYTITSANIQDGTIQIGDLSNDLADRINNANSAAYDNSSETIEFSNYNDN